MIGEFKYSTQGTIRPLDTTSMKIRNILTTHTLSKAPQLLLEIIRIAVVAKERLSFCSTPNVKPPQQRRKQKTLDSASVDYANEANTLSQYNRLTRHCVIPRSGPAQTDRAQKSLLLFDFSPHGISPACYPASSMRPSRCLCISAHVCPLINHSHLFWPF